MRVLRFLILLFLVSSCVHESKKETSTLEASVPQGDIVLIFDEMPENWKLVRKSEGYIHRGIYEVSYQIDEIFPVFWKPKKYGETDTLIIKDVKRDIEVLHKFNGLDSYSYLFKPRDSVRFTYQDNIPIADVLNRETKKYDVNYEVVRRDSIIVDGFPNNVKYHVGTHCFLENLLDWTPEYDKKTKEVYKQKAYNEFSLEKKLLKSFHEENHLSEATYDFYTTKQLYSELTIQFLENELENPSEYLRKKELLVYSFYQDFLKAIVNKKFDQNVAMIKHAQGSSSDYRVVYDSIQESTLFSREEKKYLHFGYLENIIESFSNEDIHQYYGKFINQYGNDSTISDYFVTNHQLGIPINYDLLLQDRNKKEIDFESLLEEHKGKVIYLDFWASWCAPCIKSMQASHQLKEHYKGKDVVFLYFALNDKFEPWIKASEKVGIEKSNNNFIIANPKDAKLLSELQVETIPRYILFDKTGKIAHRNAQRPDSEYTKEMINELLEK